MVQQDVIVRWLSAQHGSTRCHNLVVVCTAWCNKMSQFGGCLHSMVQQSGGCLHSMVQQDVTVWWLSAQHGATMSLFGGCLHSMVQQDVTVWWLSAQHGATRCHS